MAIPMPTAAKAAGALSFALVGWLVAHACIPGMPDLAAAGLIREGAAGLGVLVGWQVMGNAVGKGYLDAVGNGWKTMIVLTVVALFALGLSEMLRQSVRMVYDGPGEAIVDVFARMYERAKAMLTGPVLATMAVGAGLAGLFTEAVNRRWR